MVYIDVVYKNRKRFRNRLDAATELAENLLPYRGGDTLVLGIPRGGVVVADQIAQVLHADLDVALVRKLLSPDDSHRVIGAVTESGELFFREASVSWGKPLEDLIEKQKRNLIDQMTEARACYQAIRGRSHLTNRSLLVVDDGAETGATLHAAMREVRRFNPRRVVIAIPMASQQVIESLGTMCDHVLCLSTPKDVGSIDAFYDAYAEVKEPQVIEILEKYDNHLAQRS